MRLCNAPKDRIEGSVPSRKCWSLSISENWAWSFEKSDRYLTQTNRSMINPTTRWHTNSYSPQSIQKGRVAIKGGLLPIKCDTTLIVSNKAIWRGCDRSQHSGITEKKQSWVLGMKIGARRNSRKWEGEGDGWLTWPEEMIEGVHNRHLSKQHKRNDVMMWCDDEQWLQWWVVSSSE